MGNCYNSTNMGEDYLQTILLNLEVNKLFYKDINFWAISKKIELSNAEVRKEIESCNQSDKFKEETILLLESSTKEMLHFRDFENTFEKSSVISTILSNDTINIIYIV